MSTDIGVGRLPVAGMDARVDPPRRKLESGRTGSVVDSGASRNRRQTSRTSRLPAPRRPARTTGRTGRRSVPPGPGGRWGAPVGPLPPTTASTVVSISKVAVTGAIIRRSTSLQAASRHDGASHLSRSVRRLPAIPVRSPSRSRRSEAGTLRRDSCQGSHMEWRSPTARTRNSGADGSRRVHGRGARRRSGGRRRALGGKRFSAGTSFPRAGPAAADADRYRLAPCGSDRPRFTGGHPDGIRSWEPSRTRARVRSYSSRSVILA